MRIIKQTHKIMGIDEAPVEFIEAVARTCYKSEANITPGSAEVLTRSLIKRGHEAMIEFADITVRFITDRGVTHEMVRHRHCSFAQESTRYVRYDGEMEFIEPVWFWGEKVARTERLLFTEACNHSERMYQGLLDRGWSPQKARQVLNHALKTEIVVKANIREWRHILKLRTAKAAHPQMRALMLGLLVDLKERVPVVFDDIRGD